jgi:hypothetical protein
MKSELVTSDADTFLERISQTTSTSNRGRLIFALDATLSREDTWDTACKLTGDMFTEIRGLDVQLVYFRGLDECRASRWVSDPAALAALMTKIGCRGGHTQIRKVLDHALKTSAQALVYVGDSIEGPEDDGKDFADDLCSKAAKLGYPAFVFQEGKNPKVEKTFREIARLSKGAFSRFDVEGISRFRELLRSVAAFAAGGMKALDDLSRNSSTAKLLLDQMK